MEIMNMKLKMMSTLWENTYRVAIEDGQGGYLDIKFLISSFSIQVHMMY